MFHVTAPLQVCRRCTGAVPVIRLFIHSGLYTVRRGSAIVGTADDGLSEKKPGIGGDDEVTWFERSLPLPLLSSRHTSDVFKVSKLPNLSEPQSHIIIHVFPLDNPVNLSPSPTISPWQQLPPTHSIHPSFSCPFACWSNVCHFLFSLVHLPSV